VSTRPVSTGRLARLRRRIGLGAAVGLAAGMLALALRPTTPMQLAEAKAFDVRSRWTAGAAPADTSIVLISIDDRSFREMVDQFGRWPWQRGVYAAAVQYLRYAGAKAIVFDVHFADPDLFNLEMDSAFAGSMAEAQNVVLPAVFAEGDAALEDTLRRLDTRRLNVDRFAVGDARGLPDLPRAELPLRLFGEQAAAIGSIRFSPDPVDGVARRIPLVVPHQGKLFPTLALAGARIAYPERFGGAVRVDSRAARVGRASIPLQDGGMILRWRGPYHAAGRETYRSYSFFRLIRSYDNVSIGQPPPIDPALLKDKIVIIAPIAGGLLDLRSTPLDSYAPGAFIHATAIDNLLHGDWIRPAPLWANVLKTVSIALLASLLVAGIGSALWATLSAVAVLLGAVTLSTLLFRAGIWTDAATPLLAGGLAFAGAMATNYMAEGRDRQRLRSQFSRYVSPEVVRRLADDYQAIALGGQRVPVSVLFSDIRGFTAMSEKMAAEDVVEMLNEYLGSMAEIVFRHGGTLDKFIGDAVMAFWGAPLPRPDHAGCAAGAAVEMLEELERLNRKWESEGRPAGLRIGIGINTGDAVVGNIGSLGHKVEYTVIGDTVNLASRLEGLNKEMGTAVLLSPATAAALGDGWDVAPLAEVHVKGKENAVQIFELRGRRRAPSPGAVPAVVALGVLALAAFPAHGQGKLRWTDQIYQPGRWQGGQVVEWATTNPATDTLALVARVEGYAKAPRWRAEVRRMDAAGRPADPIILIGDRNRIQVLTGVAATQYTQHAAAQDPLIQGVVSRFDAQGRPTETGAARLVDRGADRKVTRITVRRPAVNRDFNDALLTASRGGRVFNNLTQTASTNVGSNRSQQAVATAGARGAVPVNTPGGRIMVNPDLGAVQRMELRAVDLLAVDRFAREGGLGDGAPVRETEGATR
jgi:adenylate cyclase